MAQQTDLAGQDAQYLDPVADYDFDALEAFGGGDGGGAIDARIRPVTGWDVDEAGPAVLEADEEEEEAEEEEKPATASRRGGRKAVLATGSSVTAEFSKRKKWSQRIIEEITDFLHVLSPTGVFLFASPSISDLCGYRPEDLIGRSIVDFVHEDDREAYRNAFNEALAARKEMGIFTRFRKRDGRYVIFEVTGHPHFVSDASPAHSAPNTPASMSPFPDSASDPGPGDRSTCKCFYAIGHPYPSKNVAMLDVMLDLKIENEKLRSKLETVYREIENDGGLQSLGGVMLGGGSSDRGGGSSWSDSSPSGGVDPSNTFGSTKLFPSSGNTYGALGIGVSSSHRGSQNGNGSVTGASAKQPHGLDGSDVGGQKKKTKKAKMEGGEFVCRACGSVDSPEWRRGPDGPKTLCNACGLRWTKDNKTMTKRSPKGTKGHR